MTVIRGTARFVSAHRVEIVDPDGAKKLIGFEQCIIAAGSEPARIPGLPKDPRVVDSTGALDLRDIPGNFLVIGGGIIGLEMACVYDALGSEVSVVELTDTLMPGCDRDLVRPLEKRLRARYAAILTGTKVTGVEAAAEGPARLLRGQGRGRPAGSSTRVLCAVGRVPNGKAIRARGGGRRGQRARFHHRRSPDAHERAAHLRDRRHRRPADAGPQGDARGQGRGRGGGRARRAHSMRA